MAVLGPVVGPAAGLLLVRTAELRHRCLVRAEAIGDDFFRPAVPPQRLLHKGQGRRLIAGFGHVAFQDLTFMIDGTPQVDPLSVHADVHLIQIPLPVAETSHARHPLALDIGGKQRTETIPYVDGSLLQEAEQIILIGSLASICTAFGCDHKSRWPRWFPQRVFPTPQRPMTVSGTDGVSRNLDRSITPSAFFLQDLPSAQRDNINIAHRD